MICAGEKGICAHSARLTHKIQKNDFDSVIFSFIYVNCDLILTIYWIICQISLFILTQHVFQALVLSKYTDSWI